MPADDAELGELAAPGASGVSPLEFLMQLLANRGSSKLYPYALRSYNPLEDGGEGYVRLFAVLSGIPGMEFEEDGSLVMSVFESQENGEVCCSSAPR